MKSILRGLFRGQNTTGKHILRGSQIPGKMVKRGFRWIIAGIYSPRVNPFYVDTDIYLWLQVYLVLSNKWYVTNEIVLWYKRTRFRIYPKIIIIPCQWIFCGLCHWFLFPLPWTITFQCNSIDNWQRFHCQSKLLLIFITIRLLFAIFKGTIPTRKIMMIFQERHLKFPLPFLLQ